MTQEKTLAHYDILHELGRGAIGPVYAARKRAARTVVALKTLDPALSKVDSSVAGRFLKLARTAQRLTHPNIARILDTGEAGGAAYVAMEKLEGESLRKILDAGPLPIARAMQIAHDVACGLAYAHLEGVVHGGIRPSNIFVLRSGGVKIADFGIAQLGGEVALRSGQRAGCLNYLSPEQVRGGPVDHRSDLFSLGALFYEMLTHRPPFKGDSAKQVTENILRGKPPLPSELNLHVPRALDRLVVSLLAAQPNDRPAGAPIVLTELQRLEEGLGLESGATAGVAEPAASAPPTEAEPRQTEPVKPPPPPEPPRQAAPPPPRQPTPPPAQDAPRFAVHADDVPHRHRIPDDDFDWRRATMMRERQGPKRSAASRAAIFGAFAIVLAVPAIVFSFVVYDWSGPIDRVLAMVRKPEAPPPADNAATGATAPAAAPVAEPAREPAPPPVAEPTKEPAPPPVPEVARKPAPAPAAVPAAPLPSPPPAEEPSASTESEDVIATVPEQPAPAAAPPAQEPRPVKAPEPPRAARSATKVQKQPPVTEKQPPAATEKQPPAATEKPPPAPAMARLILSVAPQGEIYIDGKHFGTTPPTTTFDLEPGMHRIEVRSGSRPPYLTYMMVQAGEERRIRHDFNAKPSRPAK